MLTLARKFFHPVQGVGAKHDRGQVLTTPPFQGPKFWPGAIYRPLKLHICFWYTKDNAIFSTLNVD